jgi:hypothetical protein
LSVKLCTSNHVKIMTLNILSSSTMAFYWVVLSVSDDLEGAEFWEPWVSYGRRPHDPIDPTPFPSYRYAMACARALRDMGQIVKLIRLP